MLEPRTDECINVLITKLSAILDKPRELARYALKMFRTCCKIEEIEPGTTPDLRRMTFGSDLTDLG
jgi:hypothetical protein